jgi:hypothetical protein
VILYGLLLLVGIPLLAFTLGAAVGGAGWPVKVVASAATVIFAVWLVFFVLSLTDYRDADGWADCGDSCTTLQQVTGSVLFYGLGALILCAVASFVALVFARRRASRVSRGA